MRTGRKTTGRIPKRQKRFDAFRLLFLFLVLCLIITLGTILCGYPKNSPGLAGAVAAVQEQSGVQSPVTAVLLNFRGYDTLLEVMVLLLALIGVWSLARVPDSVKKPDISPVQLGVVRLLVPVMCLVAAHLVWQGSHLAGGAFQGGALLAAAGVLLLVSELDWVGAVPVRLLRIGLVLGPLLFAGVALWCLFLNGELLAYPKGSAGWLILIIETACALSIGLTLALLFRGGRPERKGSSGDMK